MVSRRVGWACNKCTEKGWRTPIFKSLGDVEKHSVQKHKEPAKLGTIKIDVAAYRVYLWPEEPALKDRAEDDEAAEEPPETLPASSEPERIGAPV